MRNATVIARHGTRGANAGRLRMSAMGATFLRRSTTAAAGYGRRREDLVSVVGPPQVQLLEGSRGSRRSMRDSVVMKPALREPEPGRPRTRAATAMRIAARALCRRDLAVPGDAQGRRHRRQRHPQEVMQGDDRAVTRIEAPQSGVHELAVGERTGVVGMRGRVDQAQLDLDRAPAPARRVETSVDDEAMQPGVEPVGISESRQPARRG